MLSAFVDNVGAADQQVVYRADALDASLPV